MKFLKSLWLILTYRKPRLGEMIVEPAEEMLLKNVPKDMWPFELAYMRTAVNSKWDKATKIRNRKYFTAGWNAAIYTKAKLYVLSEQELKQMELDNERAANGKNR